MAETVKLSDYVIRRVADAGVKHVFLLPGGGAMHLNDSLGKCRDIEYVCNLHEQACAIAAEAYARVTNNLGVAMVTSGPGGTNAVTGVAAAWLDSTPTLFLSGQVKRADLKRDTLVRQLGVQEVDIVSIVRPITKYAVTITEPESVRFHFEKALHLARSGRPGPVWLDFPLDVQAAQLDVAGLAGYTAPAPAETTPAGRLTEQVGQLIELLNAATRPIILVGNGVRAAGAEAEFRRWVDRSQTPVLTTRLGVDLLPADSPWLVGMPGGIAPRGANFALQNCDFLLILGARLDMALIAYAPQRLARGARKVMVNIDPAEIDKLGTIVDVGIAADVRDFFAEFERQSGRLQRLDREAWLTRCRDWKTRYPFVLPQHRQPAGVISMYGFSAALSDLLTGNDVVLPGSSGFAAEIFLTAFRVKLGQRVFHNKGTGAMGLCQPSAIGACLAAGRRRTVAVDGDGGFPMNIQELETVRRLNLPIKFFVVNNSGYASIRSSQNNYFGRLVAADATSGVTLPDVVRQAEAYDLPAFRVANAAQLTSTLQQSLEHPGPTVCEVVTMPDEQRAPRVTSIQRPDGSMVSKPLEDLWPFLDREEFLANMIVPPLPEE